MDDRQKATGAPEETKTSRDEAAARRKDKLKTIMAFVVFFGFLLLIAWIYPHIQFTMFR